MTRVLFLFHSEKDVSGRAAVYEDEWVKCSKRYDAQFRSLPSVKSVTDRIDLLIIEDLIAKAVRIAENGFASGKIHTIAHCFSIETLLPLTERLSAPAIITLDFNLSADSKDANSLTDASLQRTMRAFEALRVRWPSTVMIGLTSFENHEGAKPLKEAIKRIGSTTYEYSAALKAVFPQILSDAIDRHHERLAAEASRNATQELLNAGQPQPQESSPRRGRARIARNGREQLAKILHQIERLAATRIPIIFEGESGVGKTWFAERLHQQSNRKGRFVRVNCPDLEPDKALARLFGYERGAFTGADRRTNGFVQAAAHGTLFLDDIGDLKLDVQSKLLRFLDDGGFFLEGSDQLLKSDARIIAASNIDLDDAARRGLFRQDLLYRFSPARLRIPPLRDRLDELPQLMESMFGRELGEELAEDAWDALYAYQWPGNVRELEKAVEVARALAGNDRISSKHLPAQILLATAGADTLHATTTVSTGNGKAGDAMWRSFLAGTPFFACASMNGQTVMTLMRPDGGTYEVRVKARSQKPSPFKEWIARIEDKNLARACIARAIEQSGDLTGPTGALLKIGRYLDDGHRDTVRVQITRGYRMFQGIQPTAVRRGEYEKLLQQYFSS